MDVHGAENGGSETKEESVAKELSSLFYRIELGTKGDCRSSQLVHNIVFPHDPQQSHFETLTLRPTLPESLQ